MMLSKSEKIRTYLKAGELAPKDIAKKVKVSTAYVYQIRWSDQHRKSGSVHAKTTNGGAVSPHNGNGHAGMGDLGHAMQTRLPLGSLKSEFEQEGQVDMGWKDDPLVNHPPHYTMGKIETLDYIRAKDLGFLEGNVIKYITRAKHKGDEVRDLHKAMFYLQKAIDEAEARHASKNT